MDPKILNAFSKARALPPLEERISSPPRAPIEELTGFLSRPNEISTLIPEPPILKSIRSNKKKSLTGKSEISTTSKTHLTRIVEEPKFPENARPPNQDEINVLSQTLRQWYSSFDAIEKAKQNIKEETARMKTLESMVVNMMRNHAIGALDMSSTGGRVIYKKDKRIAPVSKKDMFSILAEHQNSEDKAREILEFIDKHKTVVWKESLSFELIDGPET
jgi:hypothetical protein